MSDRFDNCSYHSNYEHSFYNCTNTTDQCELIQYVDKIVTIELWLNGIIPMILFVCAIILNALFLTILVPQFFEMNDPTRKQYVFVVSRGVSSLSASTLMVSVQIFQLFSPSFALQMILFFANDLSFYSLLGSYVGSALLLYFAATRPIFYSIRVTVKTVYFLAAANWFGSIVLSLTSATFQAAINEGGPFQCDKQHCQPVLNIVMFVIVALSFLIPIIIMMFVLLTLYLQKTRAESIGNFSTDTSVGRSARVRLAWTLFTFTLISLSEAIPSSLLVGLNVDDTIFTCSNFYVADHLVFAAVMRSLQTLAWSIAVVVDPLCGIVFDPRIRRVWVQRTILVKHVVLKLFSESPKALEQ